MKRTDNRGVAAAFARGEDAMNSNGQYYSTGGVLYSYGSHWPIAAWVVQDGKRRLHINNDKYSVTTSKQRSFMISGMVKEGMTASLENAVTHETVASIKAAIGAH